MQLFIFIFHARNRQRSCDTRVMPLTDAQIEAGRSPKGGWTREQLAAWGVPWPPPKGWRWKLTRSDVKPIQYRNKTVYLLKNRAEDFPNIPLARFYFRKPHSGI